jgi:RHS repeat-associated protein
MLDGARRIAGTGEYQPYGHVNRVNQFAATDTPYPSGYSATIANFEQPGAAGLSTRYRVLFHLVDTQSVQTGGTADDSIYLREPGVGPVPGPILYGPINGAQRGRVVTPWVQPNSGYVAVTFTASAGPANYTYNGAVVEGFEYQRYESGASPFWTPLRFPGQYHDVESDLFENWNRFYDPSVGRYLQPEPLLTKSPTLLPAFAYAANNPLRYIDEDGLRIRINKTQGADKVGDENPDCTPKKGVYALTCLNAADYKIGKPTECKPNCNGDGTFGFDIDLNVTVYINYRDNSVYSKRVYDEVERGPLLVTDHEKKHVEDMLSDLGDEVINKKYPTEGFETIEECNAARAAIEDQLQQYRVIIRMNTKRRDQK